jgi:hypothetical protein
MAGQRGHHDVRREHTESRRPGVEDQELIMVGMVPCKLSFEVQMNGWHVAAVEPAGEVETTDEPGSSARKQARVNRITGREIVGLGYLVLGEVVKKSKEGIARMGAERREVSSFRANGGEAVDTGRRFTTRER